MNQYGVLNASLLMQKATSTGWFQSLCTIQEPSGAYSRGVRTGAWVNIAGLTNIECMDAPLGFGPGIKSMEQKTAQEIASEGVRHVLLNGYYSQLDGLNWGLIGWRAIVDGVAYDISAAERDSQKSQTRLSLKLVTM